VPRRGGQRQRRQGGQVGDADAHGVRGVRDAVRRNPDGAVRMC
jgi:hypothetical protein